MFIKTDKHGYTRDGAPFTHGWFLVLCFPEQDGLLSTSEYKGKLRAFVRYNKMSQCGQFMMGRIRVGAHTLSTSGSYGNDGLIMDVPADVWERAVPVPGELYDAWAVGGGHNSAGSEALAMRDWALKNFTELHKMKGPDKNV